MDCRRNLPLKAVGSPHNSIAEPDHSSVMEMASLGATNYSSHTCFLEGMGDRNPLQVRHYLKGIKALRGVTETQIGPLECGGARVFGLG